jgi:hypothetical protein
MIYEFVITVVIMNKSKKGVVCYEYYIDAVV